MGERERAWRWWFPNSHHAVCNRCQQAGNINVRMEHLPKTDRRPPTHFRVPCRCHGHRQSSSCAVKVPTRCVLARQRFQTLQVR
jgi:hypothetical protein